MATLTETAYYSRKTIKFGIIALVVLFVLKIIFSYTVSAWKKFFPPPPPPPTVAFGKLPPIKFPSPANNGALTYTLETIEGQPPATSSTGMVFFITKAEPNLLSLNRAKQVAGKLGFSGEPQAENQTLYRWQDTNNPYRILRYDIVTHNFKITYDFAQDLGLFNSKNLPSENQAMSEAVNFLQNIGLYSPELQNSQPYTSFWRLSGNTLVTTTSLAGADAVRVDFNKQNVWGLKLMPSKPPYQSVYLIFSGSQDAAKHTLEASFTNWDIQSDQVATYPLKSSALAWQELKNNSGYIAHIADNTQKVVIRKIYLAYYYPDDYESYLQPIFVFEGDPNFIGYIPAIDPKWTGQ